MRISDLPTPALLVERDVLDANLTTMSCALPGDRLRPHVKAHKTTALGPAGFTCATVRECEVLAAAGLGPVRVGDRVRVLPAHVDPTVVLHEHMHLVNGDTVLETWPVDMRGW